MKKIIVIGTLDTKETEYRYLINTLKKLDLQPVIIDISSRQNRMGNKVDYSCVYVAKKAGYDFKEVLKQDRRGTAKIMIEGAKKIVNDIGSISSGIISIGGANGSHLACEIMRILPMGFPKIMISVVPAGDIRDNVGSDDIIVFNTIVDIYLNSIIKQVVCNACASLAGMKGGGLKCKYYIYLGK